MNTKAYELILAQLNTLFKEQEIKPLKVKNADGQSEQIYTNGQKAIKITFDEQKKLFVLFAADVDEDGTIGEWAELCAWLFDEQHNDSDAKAIGTDFEETLKQKLNLTQSKKRGALPASAQREDKTHRGPEALTQRFLAICPQYKGMHQESMEKYGAFLADDFLSKTAAVELIEVLNRRDKKQTDRFFNLLNDYYLDGNESTRSLITMTILQSLHGYPELQDQAFAKMSDYLRKSAQVALKITAPKTQKQSHGLS